ncbi:hypothetical protein DID75_03470, partial [Candidatus Marinamargulisbacteria bacterium SCGC AG-410-N11]
TKSSSSKKLKKKKPFIIPINYVLFAISMLNKESDIFINQERWNLFKANEESITNLSTNLKINPILAKIILARKIGTQNEINSFINPESSLLTDYSEVTPPEELKKGVQRIHQAIKNKEKIMINGDPDADGISGTTILVAGLRHLGADIIYDFPIRSQEGHGLQIRIIDEAIEKKASLIITTDCGTKDLEAANYANEKNIDIIITDHHIIGNILPKSVAIINPQLIKHDTLFKNLSGAGVALKFIIATFEYFKIELPESLLNFLICICTLGTLSDRMSMTNKMNRLIVKQGIIHFNTTKREGLKCLKKICIDKSQKLSKARDLSRTIIPRLNAPGRIGNPDEGIPDSKIVVDLLLVGVGKKNAQKAIEIGNIFKTVLNISQQKKETMPTTINKAQQINEVNEQRKFATEKIETEIERIVTKQINIENKKIIVVRGKNWNSGIIGIVTDRLKERYLRPAIILTESDNSNYLKASVRSIPTIDMYNILDNVETLCEKEHNTKIFQNEVITTYNTKKLVNAFGGHSQACGFTIHKDNFDLFEDVLNSEMSKLNNEKFQYSYDIIDKIEFQQISPKFLDMLDEISPYGQNFDFPIFYLENCKITKGRSFGNKYQSLLKPHIRFNVLDDQVSTNEIQAVGFGLREKYQKLKSIRSKIDTFNLIFTIENNPRWRKKDNSIQSIQLNILDIRPSNKGLD